MYDSLTFIDTHNRFPKVIAVFNGVRLMIHDQNIDWFDRDFKTRVEKLAKKRQLEPVVRKRIRKGRGPRI